MTWLAGGAALATLATLAVVLRRRYVVVRVHGVSMTPTLRDGDRVLVRRTPVAGIRPGAVVVVAMPPPRAEGDPPWLVKRAVAVPGDPVPRDGFPVLPDADRTVPAGQLVLLSDNRAAGYDSRRAGYFAADTLLGEVVRSLYPSADR
jgi:signal peptidase I